LQEFVDRGVKRADLFLGSLMQLLRFLLAPGSGSTRCLRLPKLGLRIGECFSRVPQREVGHRSGLRCIGLSVGVDFRGLGVG
jgi:hypothetical protein